MSDLVSSGATLHVGVNTLHDQLAASLRNAAALDFGFDLAGKGNLWPARDVETVHIIDDGELAFVLSLRSVSPGMYVICMHQELLGEFRPPCMYSTRMSCDMLTLPSVWSETLYSLLARLESTTAF